MRTTDTENSENRLEGTTLGYNNNINCLVIFDMRLQLRDIANVVGIASEWQI